MTWIPMKEELPPEGVNVLICIKYNNDIRYAVSRRTDYNFWVGYGRDIAVTAWMYIPEYKGDSE